MPTRSSTELRRWNRADHYLEAIKLAEQARRDRDTFLLALAQFHMTAAAVYDSVAAGRAGHQEVQDRRIGSAT